MRRGSELPVVVCIDVEPDPRTFAPGEGGRWLGFERLLDSMPPLRERLSDATGAPAAFTWLLRMDPQIAAGYGSPDWVVDAYGDAIHRVLAAGDEVGIHSHTWRWQQDAGRWIADYRDTAWVVHCLDQSLDRFMSSFGRPAEVHRGGDGFLSAELLDRLAERGVKADLTVEPGTPARGAPGGEPASGLVPDYRGVPPDPYLSSPATFPAPDPEAGEGPLLLPLFSTAPSPRPLARRWILTLESRPWVFALRLGGELARRRPPVLTFAFRSDATLRPRWDALNRNLDHLCRRHRARFVTAGAAARSLRDGR